MRLYLIVYDLVGEKEMQLQQVLQRAKGWWHYLTKAWIILSEREMADWHSEVVKTIGESGSFIMLDVSTTFINGLMPKAAWNWVNEKQSFCVRTKPNDYTKDSAESN